MIGIDAHTNEENETTEVRIVAARNWNEYIDFVIQAFDNAPTSDELKLKRQRANQGSFENISPVHGDVAIENLDLLSDAFDIIDEEFMPGFKEQYWKHEVDGHIAKALEVGFKPYMVFSFGVDSKVETPEGTRYEGLIITPFVAVEFPKDMPKPERLRKGKEMAMAVGEDDLSEGDKETLKYLDIALAELESDTNT